MFTDEASVHKEAQETVGDTGDVVLDVVAVGRWRVAPKRGLHR